MDVAMSLPYFTRMSTWGNRWCAIHVGRKEEHYVTWPSIYCLVGHWTVLFGLNIHSPSTNVPVFNGHWLYEGNIHELYGWENCSMLACTICENSKATI